MILPQLGILCKDNHFVLFEREMGQKKTATSFGYGPFLFYENRFT